MELWRRCFEDTDEFIRFYFERKYSDANSLIYEENGKALSALQMLPYPMRWENVTVDTSYISGACTLPDVRNRGFMTLLLQNALQEMYDRGIAFSTLIPAEDWLFGYYAGQGYVTVFDYALHTYTPANQTIPHTLSLITSDRFDTNFARNLFPYFDQEGRLVSVQSRYLGKKRPESSFDMNKVSLDEAKPKEIPRFKFAPGSHRMIYGLDRLKDYPPGEPLLITEGPSDCWTALTLGIHAIAIPSATLFDRRFQGLLAGRNLHIFPDQDEAGLSLYFELKKALPSLVYHQLPEGCKDLSEYYLKLRRSEGMTLEEAKAKVQGSVSV